MLPSLKEAILLVILSTVMVLVASFAHAVVDSAIRTQSPSASQPCNCGPNCECENCVGGSTCDCSGAIHDLDLRIKATERLQGRIEVLEDAVAELLKQSYESNDD